MNLAQRKYWGAAAFAALALTVGLSASGSTEPAAANEGAASTNLQVQNAEQKNQLISEYSGPDTLEGLQAEVARLSSSRVLFVMFYATWCPHCNNLTKTFEAAKDQTQLSYRVLRVPLSVGKDPRSATNPYPQLESAFNVQGTPDTYIVLKNGYIGHFGGGVPLNKMVSSMNELHQKLMDAAQKNKSPAPAP